MTVVRRATSRPTFPVDDGLYGLAGYYQTAPQWIKTVAGGAYSLLPPALRHGPAYKEFRAAFASSTVDPAYVTGRLRETLTAALQDVPAFADYRHLVANLAASPTSVLEQLPFTSKEDIKRRLNDCVNQRQDLRARMRMFTGGSTSIPMTFYVQRGVSRAKEWAAFHAMGERFGTEGAGIVLALRGRTIGTAGRGRVWSYEPIKRHLMLSTDHLEPRFMPEYVDALRRWRPVHIHAFPSALYPLLRWLRQEGYESLLSQVKSVVLTSESVFEYHMAAFKAFFDCPVMVTYGHTERVLLANTLPNDSRYHFWPQYGYLELIDSAGRVITKPGEVGEIVGTSFDNLVMPFVRYRTGDYGALGESPNAAAAGFKVLDRIEGRVQEYVVCRDHRLVTVTTLGAAHFHQLESCDRIQYHQTTPGELLLRVVAGRPLGDEARREIEQAVREKTQGGCDVKVVEVDRIPLTERGKQRLLVQELDVMRYLGAALQEIELNNDSLAVQQESQSMVAALEKIALPEKKSVLMLCTDPTTRGGIAAVVNTYRNGGLFERVPITLVPTHQDGTQWQKARRFLLAIALTISLLARNRIVLVHAHASSRASFWRKSFLLAVTRVFGVPTLFHLHSGGFIDWLAQSGFSKEARRWWVRRTLEKSSVVIVLSQGWARWARSFAPKARIIVIGNPVIVPPTLPPDSERGSKKSCGRVLYLGWIYDFKGVYDLLHAWVLFRQRCPHWRLIVGGKGEVDRLLALAKELGIEQDFEFLGWVTGTEKERQLRQADILVLPSYNEGMPISVLEGMAYGAAIATTPVGGVPDMMTEGVHGLWMKPGDIRGISDTLAELANSPELRQRLTKAAYEHVSNNNGVEATLRPLLREYASLARVHGGRN
jgi:phenylacetate-CoA ligase